MPASASYLSRYGYDFVVSTTQASINSGLLEYFSQGNQPVTYMCFLASNKKTKTPPQQISLEDLMKKTGGINPFDIPDGTDYDDDRITVLTRARFVCGFKMQIGLPPGFLPKDLPPVVVLGNSANNVLFRMYCSQFSVVQNSPPDGFDSDSGTWSVWHQPTGQASSQPWSVETSVNLVVEDLDRNLANSQHFKDHPVEKANLLASLNNLGATAFSLQQLVLDLENAIMQTLPRLGGSLKGSDVEALLTKYFVSVYWDNAKQIGQPLISVHAVSDSPDASQLQMTSFERAVSQMVDGKGFVIQDPSALEKDVTTLNFLCAINGHIRPSPPAGSTAFSWNWVEPSDIDVESGIISINRNVIAEHFRQQLALVIPHACFNSEVHVSAHWEDSSLTYSWTLTGGQQPHDLGITPGDQSRVIYASYSSNGEDSDSSGAVNGALRINPTYTCNVFFEDNTIKVVQQLLVFMHARRNLTSVDFNIVNKTLTDVYTISVDQEGIIQISQPASSVDEINEGPDVNDFVDLFINLEQTANDIKKKVSGFTSTTLKTFDFRSLQSFVFPGGKVFTYKSATFSKHQDLICAITYVKPSPNQVPQDWSKLNPGIAPPFPIPGGNQGLPQGGPTVAPPFFLPDPPPPKGDSTPAVSTDQNTNTSRPSTPLKLTYSSEMMRNYVQGEIVSPVGKFVGLQSDDGHTLLFSTGTDNVLNVIEEQNGKTQTGWVLNDISSAAITSTIREGKVRTFDAGQSVFDGTIGLAMAVTSGNLDNLFISLFNSSVNTSWIAKPNWTLCPFDATGNIPSAIRIVSILFAETTEKHQYLIVDIDRSLVSNVKDIARYYIDPARRSGTYWEEHDVPVDIEEDRYQSCVGRALHAVVDGVYTAGISGVSAQLVYVPMINVFGRGPPMPTRLTMPGSATPSAIAAARNDDQSSELHGTTDLYVTSGSTLFRFNAEDQESDGALGKPLLTSKVISETSKLIAMTHNGVTTLWGRNGSDEVFYTSCAANTVSDPRSWSSPVPILFGIEQISTYVNKSDGGNTIFAAGAGKLQKLVQATGTSSKTWQAQEIKLTAPPRQESLSFNSYTTSIQVADEQGLPARGLEIAVSAKVRSPVYINGIYYILQQSPTKVATDSAGSITIIEATNSINGTIIAVAVPGAGTTAINPMEKPFKKLAALNSQGALMAASVQTSTVAGGVLETTGTRPLVSPSTSDKKAQAVAGNMDNLNKAFDSLIKPKVQQVKALRTSGLSTTASLSPTGAVHLSISSGDIYQWLKSGVEAEISLFEDAANGVWHFIAQIAGKVYSAVLDSVEAIIGAVEWVFNAIETAIEDLILFLQFLFAWKDIRRTKDVMHNVIRLFLDNLVSGVSNLQSAFDGQIAAIEDSLNKWAGIKDWSSLGPAANNPIIGSFPNPGEGQTALSMLFANHFRDHVGSISMISGIPSMNMAQSLVDDLLEAVSKEGAVLSAVYDQLQTLARDFPSMNVGQVLQRVAGIIVDEVLSSVQVVVDALLKVLVQVASSAIGILEAKLHIPIISDILNELGIPDVSFLDLFLWIASVGYTVVYKIAKGSAPFPDNDGTAKLISAPDWSSLAALFHPTAPVSRMVSKMAVTTPLHTSSFISDQADPVKPASTEDSDVFYQHSVYVAGHGIAGFLSSIGLILVVPEATQDTGDSDWSIPAAVMGVIMGASLEAANWFLPPYPIEDKYMSGSMMSISGITILSKILFCGPIQRKFGASKSVMKNLKVADGRATGAIINATLVIASLTGTGWHFSELRDKPDGPKKTAAILGEASNLCQYVSRVSYAAAVNTESPNVKMVEVAVLAVSMFGTAGLQYAMAAIQW
jgi:hypothetical protein